MDPFGDDDDFDITAWDIDDNVAPNNENSNNFEPPAKVRKREPRLFPGPAGILPKLNVESKHIALKLKSIKEKRKDLENQDGGLSLSQMEKEDGILTKKELIDNNRAWHALKEDPLYTPENAKFDSTHIINEATEGVALKMPIFFCVIKSMDMSSGLDVNCEVMDIKGEINGLIRREVFDDYPDNMRPGTALVLKVYTI